MTAIINKDFALTPAERKKLFRNTSARGYAAPPGTGPEGETCGTCASLHRHQMQKTYLKCNRVKWTLGKATDILARSPACRLWTQKGPAT
jgi:hypothetical protein